jgi:anti-sigma regulatory factor (Ser/Thr protein kinase)
MDGTADGDKTLILDTMFDSGTLHTLRAAVQSCASRFGLAGHRVDDMVLAIHELAANAVQHGAGAGRLRIWDLAGALRCQVDDGASAFDDPGAPQVADPGDIEAAERAGPPVLSMLSAWITPGHGLWVVQQVADQLRVTSGPWGTTATATFRPAPAGGAASCL